MSILAPKMDKSLSFEKVQPQRVRVKDGALQTTGPDRNRLTCN